MAGKILDSENQLLSIAKRMKLLFIEEMKFCSELIIGRVVQSSWKLVIWETLYVYGIS